MPGSSCEKNRSQFFGRSQCSGSVGPVTVTACTIMSSLVRFWSAGLERREVEHQAMVAGRPGLGELVLERLVVVPDELLAHQLAIIGREAKPALARLGVEIAVDLDLDGQAIGAVVLGLVCLGDLGFLVKGHPLAPRAVVATELGAGDDANGHGLGHGGHGLRDDRLGRLDVLFQQQRRDREHVADIVEPVARVVGRKFLVGAEVDPHQVADRVAVLDPVEPAQRDPARVGIVRVGPEGVALDPVFEGFHARRPMASACPAAA